MVFSECVSINLAVFSLSIKHSGMSDFSVTFTNDVSSKRCTSGYWLK